MGCPCVPWAVPLSPGLSFLLSMWRTGFGLDSGTFRHRLKAETFQLPGDALSPALGFPGSS